MSEWTQFACGGHSYSGVTESFQQLHIHAQGNYSLSYAAPGTQSLYHIYDDPAYFGNSRPTALCVLMDGRPVQPGFQTFLANWMGEMTLHLWRDESRSSGVWAKVSEALIDPVWICAFPSVVHGVSFDGFSFSSREQDFLTPLPSNLFVSPNYFSAVHAFRTLSYGIFGQPAKATYDLSQVPHERLQLEIAIVQFPSEETATCVVGDFSKPSWHYSFDAEASFIPEGFVSPFTLASISIQSTESPVVLQNGASSPLQCTVSGPAFAGFSTDRVWRYSAGQFSEYHHNGHYPESGVQRFFRKGLVQPPLRKPRSGAVPGSTENMVFESSSYDQQRRQFSVGNFSVPKLPTAGHWSVLPSSAPQVDGALSIALERDETTPPPRQSNNEITPEKLSSAAYPALAAIVNKTLNFEKVGVSGMPLAHNCAYSSESGISENVNGIAGYNGFFGYDGSTTPWKPFLGVTLFDAVNEYVPPPVNVSFNTRDASAYVAAYNAAIANREVGVQAPNEFISAPPNVYYAASWEYRFILNAYQCFASFSRRLSGTDILPQGNESPVADVSTSGNLDAWQKGVPASFSAGADDLLFEALIWVSARVEARNIRIFAYPVQATGATTARIGGQPFVAWTLPDEFLTMHQASLQLGTTLTRQQAFDLGSGNAVVVPGYVSTFVGNAWRGMASNNQNSLQSVTGTAVGRFGAKTCIGYRMRLS